MLTVEGPDERWEYRRAHRGDAAEWARAPAIGATASRPGERLWRTQRPPTPAIVTEVAALMRLAQGDERIVSLLTAQGEVWHLRRQDRSGEVGIRGAVVWMWRGEADDRVQPARRAQPAERGRAATDAGDERAALGGTTDDDEAALCGWLMDVATDPLHPVPPGAWRALSSASPVVAFAREVLPLDEPVGFYDGPSEVLGALRDQGLWLWTVNWRAEVSEHDWAVFQWIYGRSTMWNNLRVVLPPRAAITHLLSQRPAPDAVDATLRTLRTLYDGAALTLARLAEHADALDSAGIGHGLRAGEVYTPRATSAESDGAESDGAGSDGAESDGAESDGAETDGAESDGARHGSAAAEVVIELGQRGLRWRVADPKRLSISALITLSMGPHVGLVPPSLQVNAEAMLMARQGPESGRTALYWRLLGMPVDVAALIADPTCAAQWHDVLRWAEQARAGRRGAPPWLEGLMTLAEAHVAHTQPLAPADADRLWRLVADAEDGGRIISRLFGLVGDARALLSTIGCTFERLPTVMAKVRHRNGTRLRTLDPDRAPTGDTSTPEPTEARHG